MNSPEDISPLLRDIIWGVQHDAFEDRLGQSLLRAWSVGAGDSLIAGMIHDRVRPLQTRELFGTLHPFRKPQLNHGNIILGLNADRSRIPIFTQVFNAGCQITANTGSGKTTLLNWLLLQIAADCNFWAFEMYKEQLRHLRPLLRRINRDVAVIRSCAWKFNPLQAACDPRIHLSFITDVLVRELNIPESASRILTHACHDLYRQWNIWQGQQDAWPTLFDVYEWTLARTQLNTAARDALLDRLGFLLTSLTPACAAYRRAWTASDLSQHSVIFEFRGASETVKQIVTEALLFSLFQAEVERGSPNGAMRLLVAVEDGQRFFANRDNCSGFAPMEELAGIIRGSGIGLLVLVQSLIGFSRKLGPNLASKIMGRLGAAQDYSHLGSDMSMTSEQVQWAKRSLRPGLFICQLSDGAWREPFELNIPAIRLPSTVTDIEAEASIRSLDQIRIIPATEFARWEPHHIVTIGDSPIHPTQKADPASKPSKPQLSEAEVRLLRAVVDQPGLAANEYSSLTKIAGNRAAQIREKLVGLGMIREHTVAAKKRGRPSLILEPLDAGREFLKTEEVS